MQEKDKRHPVAELFVEDFVAEEVHGQEGGGAAAECGEEEQRDLGDATQLMLAPVAVMDSFPLVDTVGQECEQIDRKEIIGQ